MFRLRYHIIVINSTYARTRPLHHRFNSYLGRLSPGVKHGIHPRDVLHNVIDQCCRLTFQFLNPSFGHFRAAQVVELVRVANAFVGELYMDF